MREVSESTATSENQASDNFNRVELFDSFSTINRSKQRGNHEAGDLEFNTQSLYGEQSVAQRTPRGSGDSNDGAQNSTKAESENQSKFDSPARNLAASRSRLEAVADSKIDDPLDRAIFKAKIDEFGQRAVTGEIDKEEAARTYAGIEKLLTAQGDTALTPSERSILAQNAMYHAAEPSGIDQGRFNTCNVSALEEKLFTENPSRAVDILNSVAIDGRYTAPDGRDIILDAKSLDPLVDSPIPFDGDRSYATQVLNHVLANDITQRRVPPQFYSQQNQDDQGRPLSPDDNGERLRYLNGKPVPSFDGKNSPQVTFTEIEDAVERHLGEKGQLFLNSDFGAMDGEQTRFGSADELASHLQNSLDKKTFPILGVNGYDRIFTQSTESGFGGHVVSLRGYDPVNRTVNISNEWGRDSDLVVPLNDLFRASMAPGNINR